MGHNYLDSISPQELDRLKAQHEAWLPETYSILTDHGFSQFNKIVEFGCGPGFSAHDLATKINPQAQVTALDISEYYLGHARQRVQVEAVSNLEVIQHNAAEPIELSEQFDGAFCRWFLAWVTKDIDAVLRNIRGSLKPGGTFAAMEYLTLKSTVHSPPCKILSKYLDAWETFYIDAGGTTEVGASLPEKFSSAGFEVRDMRCVGGYSPKGDRLYNWWKRLYFEFGSKFEEQHLLTTEDLREMNQYWELSEKDSNSFIFSPILLQIVATKC